MGVFLLIAVGCSSDAGVGDDAVCSPSPSVSRDIYSYKLSLLVKLFASYLF